MRILIVDDQPANCEMLADLLETMGHESDIAHSGAEALNAISGSIDLVLLDIMMPGMDGFEVARQIRRNTQQRDIPIIMVTALDSKEDRLRAVEAGANDFIGKPIDKTELRVRTESQLKVKAAQDAMKQHNAYIEELVAQRTSELRESKHLLQLVIDHIPQGI